MLQPCIICYKNYNRQHADVSQGSEGLTHFFKLLGRHLDDDNGNGSSESKQLPFEQLIQAGMLTCKDCSKLVDSFCELYHKMKSVELQLSSKLQTLTDIMAYAGNVPTRIKNFQKNINQLQFEDINPATILDSKADLVKKCTQKLQQELPRPVIKKFNSSSIFSDSKPKEFLCSAHWDELDEETGSRNISTRQNEKAIKDLREDEYENSKQLNLHSSHNTVATSTDCLKTSQVAKSLEQGSRTKKSPVLKQEPNDSQSESYYHQDEADKDFGGQVNVDYSLETEQLSGERFLKSLLSFNKSANTSTQQGKKRTRKPALNPSKNPETVKCSDCPQEFSNIKGFQRHHSSVHQKRRFQCTTCNKQFTRREHYNRHYDVIHLGIKFLCFGCNKSFSRKDKLSNHQRTSACRDKRISV